MNTEILKKVQSNFITKKVPVIEPGYTVEVDTIIREGNKQRIQKFRGLVIAVSGTGTDRMITVRKISSGYAVEKKLPLFSKNIGNIKVIKKEKVRRSKLYFMRDRVGKSAMRIKKGKSEFVNADDLSYIDVEEIQDKEVMAAQVEETSADTTAVESSAETQS